VALALALALAKKLRPKVLWDYKSHLGFNCRRILFSELYFKIYVSLLHLCQVVKFWFLVLLSLLYKRLQSTKKNRISLLHLLSQAFALWDGLGNVALALALALALSGLALLTSLARVLQASGLRQLAGSHVQLHGDGDRQRRAGAERLSQRPRLGDERQRRGPGVRPVQRRADPSQ